MYRGPHPIVAVLPVVNQSSAFEMSDLMLVNSFY